MKSFPRKSRAAAILEKHLSSLPYALIIAIKEAFRTMVMQTSPVTDDETDTEYLVSSEHELFIYCAFSGSIAKDFRILLLELGMYYHIFRPVSQL